MPRFTDADGREWPIAITIPDVRRVRTELDVDLLDLAGGVFNRILSDPVLVVDVLYVLLSAEAQKRGVDAEAFAAALRGDAIDAASQALLEGLIDFFPSRRRAVMEAALKNTRIWMDRQTQTALGVLEGDKMDRLMEAELARLEQTIDRRLEEISGGPSPDGPPSPALKLVG